MSICTVWHVSGLWPFAFHILKHCYKEKRPGWVDAHLTKSTVPFSSYTKRDITRSETALSVIWCNH